MATTGDGGQVEDWDEYWNKRNRGGWLYALVAEFYRRVIIRPNLNRMIRKCFRPNSLLLHAGCGSGQVDTQVCRYASVTALDISSRALELYEAENGSGIPRMQASIFDIPAAEKTFDGIYNLGVMEHFFEPDLVKILQEFRRVLKDDGRLLLFWPPEFGLSVMFFKTLRRTIRLSTGRDVKFHPDEVSRIRSREHVSEILKQGGFQVDTYSFGPRDLWTQSIVVAKKDA